MDFFRHMARPVSCLVATCLLSLNPHPPAAHAAMVDTGAVIQQTETNTDRDRVREALSREDLARQLAAYGVDPAQVIARVDALTDAEAARLARHLDEMPAGGTSIIGAAVFVFLVLLVTDLLGLTNVFSFTNKGSARR